MIKTIAIPVLSIRHHGGIKILVELANTLSEWATVEFLVPQGCINTPYDMRDAVKVREIKTGNLPRVLVCAIFLVKCIPRLMKYDLVLANFFVTYFSAFIASSLSRVKLAYIVQGIESHFTSPLGKILNVLCELTYKSNSIITANPFLEQEILKRRGKPLFNFTVGVSDIFFSQPLNTIKEFDVICFVRKESLKNLDMFIEFLEAYPTPLTVSAVSQDSSVLKQLADRSFVRHQLSCFKPVDTQSLIEILDKSRVLVSTSLHEGFSLPPLEAMARRVSVLLYPSGGPSLYVKDGVNALYFTTVEEMIEKVAILLSNADLREKLIMNAAETATQYRLSTELDRLSDFFKSEYA